MHFFYTCRVLLQKIKLNSQIILIIGILMSITGYLLVCDWQTIPYDTCTEYSPFHHPDQFQNVSAVTAVNTNYSGLLRFYSDVELNTGNGNTLSEEFLSIPGLTCQLNKSCPKCRESRRNFNDDSSTICLTFTDIDFTSLASKVDNTEGLLTLVCNFQKQKICITIQQTISFHSKTQDITLEKSDAVLQSLLVLPDDVYASASNSCMNVLDGQCQWIPFSTITNSKCIDCPPICRGKHRSLLFAPFLLGMTLLVMSNPFTWVPTIALATDQTPNGLQVNYCTR